MVKILSVIIMGHNNTKPITFASAFELSSFGFWNSGKIREVCQFVSRETISRTGL